MKKKIMILLMFVSLAASQTGTAFGDGLTREQGDAILDELKQIRQLLEKQQKNVVAPAAAPTRPERVRLKIGKEFALGSGDAPFVMVEYTDYQCPFCNRFFTSTFPELKKRYIDTGKLRFIARDYPLEFHPQALKAAQAVRCAGEQGKFWPMKDSLMTNSARLTPELITSLAQDVSLDMGKFRACADEGRYLSEIRDGIADANAVGINGTPSFILGRVTGEYLDGYLIVGAQPLAAFDALMNEMSSGGK